MGDQFLVRFWGVRGSYPVPGAGTLKYGGNTPCVEVRVAGHTIILDGGTGMIRLGEAMIREMAATGRPIAATILFSHTHHDHTQGFPYFGPAYIGSSTLYIFGPRQFQEQLAETLSKNMLPPNFPLVLDDLQSTKIISNIHESDQVYLWPGQPEPLHRNTHRDPAPGNASEAVRVDVKKSYAHPQEGVFFYRISYQEHSVVYASDTEGYIGGDQRLADFARDADLLIHDAQYTREEYLDPARPKQGWGHSTPEMALAVAQRANVKRVAFFHLNPPYDDDQLAEIESQAKREYDGALVAKEGLEIDLTNDTIREIGE